MSDTHDDARTSWWLWYDQPLDIGRQRLYVTAVDHSAMEMHWLWEEWEHPWRLEHMELRKGLMSDLWELR